MRLALALLSILFSFSAHANCQPIDFVIDLDGTLFYTITDPRQVKDSDKLLHFGDFAYRPTEGAEAFVQSLLDIPCARISFFSGGPGDRNQYLLERLHLPKGGTAFSNAYKLLSKDDLTVMVSGPDAAKLPFTSRFKKDLSKIAPEFDGDRTLLIDDHPEFVLPGQERNVLSIEPSYDYVENYSRFVQNRSRGMRLKHPPQSRESWAFEREKLARARGLIEEALERSNSPGTSFSNTVYSLQHDEQGLKDYPFGLTQRRYFAEGFAIFKRYEWNPCAQGFTELRQPEK